MDTPYPGCLPPDRCSPRVCPHRRQRVDSYLIPRFHQLLPGLRPRRDRSRARVLVARICVVGSGARRCGWHRHDVCAEASKHPPRTCEAYCGRSLELRVKGFPFLLGPPPALLFTRVRGRIQRVGKRARHGSERAALELVLSLEDLVPEGHFYRRLQARLDLLFTTVRGETA